MAPTLKKRNIVDSQVSRLPFQNAINSYGRISKSAAPAAPAKQSKVESCSPLLYLASSNGGSGTQPAGSRKRRREESHNVPSKRGKTQNASESKPERPVGMPKLEQAKNARQAASKLPTVVTPVKRKTPLQPKSRRVETPTRGARAILEAFAISKPVEDEQAVTAPKTDRPNDASERLDELTALHDAFLKTLALHFAHHGTASPAELRLLLPSVQRAWGKRRLAADDIRRVLGIQRYGHDAARATTLSLTVADYGGGKLCIEYESATDAVLPVDALRRVFAANLEAIRADDANIDISRLPLAPIVPANPDDVGPRRPSKGAQRLFDLKSLSLPTPAFGLPTPPPSSPAGSAPETPTKAAAPAGRASALLERVRAKEAHAASLPAPPSEEIVARRSALMRLPEVIPVVDQLASNKLHASAAPSMSSADALAALMGGATTHRPATAPASASFTMAGVVQHVRNSLRNPIAKDEAERCIRLAAVEVVPGWISIREVGKVVAVVVRGRVGRGEWTAKVEELLREE